MSCLVFFSSVLSSPLLFSSLLPLSSSPLFCPAFPPPPLSNLLQEEHHIAGFDPASFFTLHDFDNDGLWTPTEIGRTYGLYDPSNAALPPQRRTQIVDIVLALFDGNGDGRISRDEWRSAHAAGAVLPDLGTGPGHHGDDEYEYEIHHWEKYHDENTKLEDLTHPEDIAHFRHHEELEAEAARLEALDRLTIVLDNVPSMFRRRQ